MKILVTGGLGFIGSHTVVELIDSGHETVIVDNLSNSKIEVLSKIETITGVRPRFFKSDLLDYEELDRIFASDHFDAVIHFAGFKAVSESIAKPLAYYHNNICGTINLLRLMQKHGCKTLVFSSSACVYGEPKVTPISESAHVSSDNITNPYGRTKFFIEQILCDLQVADPSLNIIILRYFNPVGAHKSGLLGEDPNDIPNNLMPVMLNVARGKTKTLHIYGKDYDTVDGTCVRDFIHVVDLAKGHVKALEKLKSSGVHIYNLATGKGTSVLELVNTFNNVNGNVVDFDFAERRPGDVAVTYTNPDKAKTELGWSANLSIVDMCRDAYNFAMKHK